MQLSKKRSPGLSYHDEYKPCKILRSKQLTTSPIGLPPTVRQGKWSIEEERQTEQIITDFFDHNLPDCSNGCSLRSYLADKLNSSKMRISKKLAHRCVGSAIYGKVESSSAVPRAPSLSQSRRDGDGSDDNSSFAALFPLSSFFATDTNATTTPHAADVDAHPRAFSEPGLTETPTPSPPTTANPSPGLRIKLDLCRTQDSPTGIATRICAFTEQEAEDPVNGPGEGEGGMGSGDTDNTEVDNTITTNSGDDGELTFVSMYAEYRRSFQQAGADTGTRAADVYSTSSMKINE